MKKYFYYTYKITCTEGELKNHFYYGRHRTTNLNDSYKGSGNKLREYYNKFPNGYIKEIIAFYNSQEELEEGETILINKHINDPLSLNLGGSWNTLSDETKNKISKSLSGRIFINKDGCTRHIKKDKLREYISLGWSIGPDINFVSSEHKKNISKSLTGRKLSDSHKKHISEANKGKQLVLGKIWVNNNNIQTLINKNDLQKYISNGYSLGMIKK